MNGLSKPPVGVGEANGPVPRENVEAQLARILCSAGFSNSGRLKDFLSYVVYQKLDTRKWEVTERAIARVVFRRTDFDPALDAIVRRSAARLRKELANYNAGEGREDSVIIEIPKGYKPQFSFRPVPPAPPEAPLADPPLPIRRPRRWWKHVAGVLALFLSVVAGQYFTHGRELRPSAPIPAPTAAIPPRFLAHATSEGQTVPVIGSERHYGFMLITPDGTKLYAVEFPGDQWVTVFETAGLKEKYTFRLPTPVSSGFMSRDGMRIYFGSRQNGVIVVNTASNLMDRTISTGGAVFGLAVSPDNRKLFVAMGPDGVERIDLQTGDVRLLSSVAYPIAVGLDRAGRNLYVSYQHGGPGGRRGHDVIEIYDVATERVSYVIKDLPMVGAKPLFAPNDEVVLLDILDACFSKYYDHVGCPALQSGGFYLWRPADRRLVATLPFPTLGASGGFLPEGTRLFFAGTGGELAVWDWARQQMLEKMRPPEAVEDGEIASSRNRVFVRARTRGILVFEAEKPECEPPVPGLANFYSGDGTLDDARGTGKLISKGDIRFAPGRIGQAFDFTVGSTPLTIKMAADYCPYCTFSWTEAFFVKFRSIGGRKVLLESTDASGSRGRRIIKTADNHIVLEMGGGIYPKIALSSASSIESGRWYHVAVVTNNDHKSLFVDGVLQDERIVPVLSPTGDQRPVILGADHHGHDALDGLLDEIVVYDRALTPSEVKPIAQSCIAP